MTGDKKCNFISLYRSRSKSNDNFESFTDNLELNLDVIVSTNPYLIVLLGDFNAHTPRTCNVLVRQLMRALKLMV